MSKLIVTYNLFQGRIEDPEFMQELKKMAFEKSKGRELERIDIGYENDDYIKNYVTVHFIYK